MKSTLGHIPKCVQWGQDRKLIRDGTYQRYLGNQESQRDTSSDNLVALDEYCRVI